MVSANDTTEIDPPIPKSDPVDNGAMRGSEKRFGIRLSPSQYRSSMPMRNDFGRNDGGSALIEDRLPHPLPIGPYKYSHVYTSFGAEMSQ